MKTEMILCDMCKNKLGIYKCSICDKDTCETDACHKEINISLYRGGTFLGNIERFTVCRNCINDDRLSKILSDTKIYKEDKLEFASKVINSIKKRLIVEKLEK
jgi:hypothetical protein